MGDEVRGRYHGQVAGRTDGSAPTGRGYRGTGPWFGQHGDRAPWLPEGGGS
jgi:hypothetical protein